MYECKKCNSSRYVKAGLVRGEQRYKCQDCGCQFVPTGHKGRSTNTKIIALFLYVSGLSMRQIAKLVKTDVHAVHRWIHDYGRANLRHPVQMGDGVTIGLGEMCEDIRFKRTLGGVGSVVVSIPLDLLTGDVEGEIRLHLSGFTSD